MTASVVDAVLSEERVVVPTKKEVSVTTAEVAVSSDFMAVPGRVSTTSLERVTWTTVVLYEIRSCRRDACWGWEKLTGQ